VAVILFDEEVAEAVDDGAVGRPVFWFVDAVGEGARAMVDLPEPEGPTIRADLPGVIEGGEFCREVFGAIFLEGHVEEAGDLADAEGVVERTSDLGGEGGHGFGRENGNTEARRARRDAM